MSLLVLKEILLSSKIAAGPLDWDYYRTAAVQEKYMKDEDEDD